MNTPALTLGYCTPCNKSYPPVAGQPALYCRDCGSRLEQRPVSETPAMAESPPMPPLSPEPTPWNQPPILAHPEASPGLAFLLGFIPGVGAIYNGQYAKGLVHVVIFGMLISIISSNNLGAAEPVFVMLIPVWVFYMCFEAYHTAKKRQYGKPVDEFSSLVPWTGGTGFPVAPVVLIGLGSLFLLNNLDVLRISQVIRFWPVLLIAAGVGLLYQRVTEAASGKKDGRDGDA